MVTAVDRHSRPDSDRIERAVAEAKRLAAWGCGIVEVYPPRGDGTDSDGKKPIGEEWQKRASRSPHTIEEIVSRNGQYGVIPWPGERVLVLDVDHADRLPTTLPAGYRVTRGIERGHAYFRLPAGFDARRLPATAPWGEVRVQGASRHVVGPYSRHATGDIYIPHGNDLTEIPVAVLEALFPVLVEPEKPEGEYEIPGGGYELPDFGYTGSRYVEILRFIGSRYMKGIPLDEIWVGVVYTLAPRFAEPLTEAELRDRFERAWKTTPDKFGPPGILTDAPAPIIELPVSLPAPPVTADVAWPAAPDAAAYHGILGDIIEAIAPTTEADPVAILGTLLAATGACFGRWRTLYQGSAQATNLFVALVGESSVGRKGTAASIGRDVMTAAYPDWERLIVTGLGSGEGLVGHLKARADDKDPDKRDHRALVLETEFGRLLTVMAREGSTLSPVIRDAWDGSAIGRFIAREQSLVTWHHVSVAAHVTSVELRQKMSSVDAANGFGNRFLWLAVRRTRLVPFPESPRHLMGPFADDLNQAIVSAQIPGEMRWSQPAADRWESMYAESSARRLPGLIGALTARREAQTARLALLYALLDRSPTVDLVHLQAGEAVWQYAERSAIHIFGVSTGSRRADQLLMLVADGPIDWKSAKQELGIRESSDLQDAIDVLSAAGLATVVTVPRKGGGRPLRVITGPGATDQRVSKSAETHPPAQPEGA